MKYSLLAAAYLSLSACAPFEQKVETPLVDIGSSGMNLEVTEILFRLTFLQKMKSVLEIKLKRS